VDELTWKPAWQLRDLMASGELSPVEVTDHFLARIEKLDPVLRAFAHVDAAGARAQAARAERAAADREPLGPLHGIPVSVKEHIAVAGLPLRRLSGGGHRVAAYDDLGIERLRAAGAVIVGTNTMMGSGTVAPKPSAAALKTALAVRQRNWQRFRRVLADHDLLLSPTSQLIARPAQDWDAAWTRPDGAWPHATFAPHYTSHTHMFNWLGWPAVSVPCGFVDGPPVGLQIIGKPGSEATIFRAAAAFQGARPPLPEPPTS
jgi:Asp-tRNA(Asn)/Glu-tRNA(Gln) amidotransferase A subunit family amidase